MGRGVYKTVAKTDCGGRMKKKSKMTVSVIVGAVASLLGIYTGLPVFLRDLAENGPDWLLDPNVVWFEVVLTVTGIAVWWIHSRPDEPEIVFDDYIARHFPALSRQLGVVRRAKHFMEIVVSAPQGQPENAKVFGFLEEVIQPQVEKTFDAAALRDFKSVLSRTKKISEGLMALIAVTRMLEIAFQENLESELKMREGIGSSDVSAETTR